MISRSEVDCANYYSIGHLFDIQQTYLFYMHWDETKSESWPDRVLVSTARVKLELTDFRTWSLKF